MTTTMIIDHMLLVALPYHSRIGAESALLTILYRIAAKTTMWNKWNV